MALTDIVNSCFQAVRTQADDAWLEHPDSRRHQHDREMAIGLQQHADEFAQDWRARIVSAFERWQRGATSVTAQEQERQGLRLVSEAQLSLQLLAQDFGDAVLERHGPSLESLELRLTQLARAQGADVRAASPLWPAPVGLLFVEGFVNDDLSNSLCARLMAEFDNQLRSVLEELYSSIDHQLEQAGYTGHRSAEGVRVASRNDVRAAGGRIGPGGAEAGRAEGREKISQASAQAAVGWTPDGGVVEGIGSATGAGLRQLPTNSGMDAVRAVRAPVLAEEGVPMRYRDIVHDHLQQWRAAAGHASAVDDAVGHEDVLGTQAMYTVASLLQGDDATTFAQLLSRDGGRPLSGAIRDAVTSGARQLGLAAAETLRFAPEQEDAIDLVAMLFEALMHTRHAAAAEHDGTIPRLYGRLVMPYLKIALLDDSLFNRRNHPARQLIDALAEICEEESRDPQAQALAEGVVDRIVTGYNADLAIFELAVDELRQFQRQQRRRAELTERRTAEALHGRERLDQARLQTRNQLQAWSRAHVCTDAVADFLREDWCVAHERACLRQDVDPSQPVALVRLGEVLLRLDAKARKVDGDGVARDWLELSADLNTCCRLAGLDTDGTTLLAARLVFAFAHPDVPRGPHRLVPEEWENAAKSDGDGDGDAAGALAALDLSPGLRLVGGIATLDHDPALAARMRRLRPGQSLRLIDAEGRETPARVAWISALTARLLIVNRRGQRELVVSPEQLAVLVGAGRVAISSDDAPFDQAMKRLWQQLNHARDEPSALSG